MIETVVVPPTPYPTGFLWWFRNGDSWHAPEINNGLPYLPDIHNGLIRDLLWFARNPIGNFMGFVVGFEGLGYVVRGPAPVKLTTGRDGTPPILGWRWCIINGWAPYISLWGPVWYLPKSWHVEFYLGWRPASGGLGLKYIPTKRIT